MRNEKNSTGSNVHDTDSYLQSLMVTNPLQESVMRRAIHALNLPPESHGLDVGCGIGLQTIILAEAVGAAGHVTGVDLSLEFPDYARSIAEKAGISEKVSFREGDMNNLQFDDDAFDWVWSANCAGYAPGEPLPMLKELARVVKPGGSVIIIAWSSQQLLPGYPVLEAHPNATSSGIAPFAEEMAPDRHFSHVTARTFARDVFAPLSGRFVTLLPRFLGCGGWMRRRSCRKRIGWSIGDCVWLSRRSLFWIFRITTRSMRI